MKHLSEFRSPETARNLLEAIRALSKDLPREIVLMEVCGTHTMSSARMGLKEALPPRVKLLAGPGCPVCVSPASFVRKAVRCADRENTVVATFGDMLRVPADGVSLMKKKEGGRDVRVVYSPREALDIARKEKGRTVVFIGAGFETTAPAVAAAVSDAAEGNDGNFFLLSGHKTMPPAMRALAGDPGIRVDGFICPGHVSAVTGSGPYEFLAREYSLPCVVAGFEPVDILQALFMLVSRIIAGSAGVDVQYSRAVGKEGNRRALETLYSVFEACDSEWRGMGTIPGSGLRLREEFARFDMEKKFPVPGGGPSSEPGCICGDILKGKSSPRDCPLFAKKCSPRTPAGACMVSSEGACAAEYRYGGGRDGKI